MISATQQIINARIPGYKGLQMLTVHEGIIGQISSMDDSLILEESRLKSKIQNQIDVEGDWISLGGVDLQINGALGLAFPEIKAEDRKLIISICEFLWNAGVDAFLPTLVTTSVENIHRALSVIADLQKLTSAQATAKILGAHLEGPFLNFQKRGAHPAEYLLPLTLAEVKRVLGDYAGVVKVITLAPELDVSSEVISYIRSLGITVSLGHSQATASQAQAAFELGATMVTHAFNAMPPLHHREPGLLGAAMINTSVMCGLIADGEHVSPIMLQILLRANQQGVFLVSDALAPLGLPDGVYPWDSRQITVKNGTARLADGTLSGTTLPLLVGVQNVVKWGICSAEQAIALATEAPRKALNLPGITEGEPAFLLRWHLDDDNRLSWQRLIT